MTNKSSHSKFCNSECKRIIPLFVVILIEIREANLLEGRNVLPANEKYLYNMANYKTCKHSEELSGKPMNGAISKLIKDLPIENFIHFSDPENHVSWNWLNSWAKQ